MRVLKFLSKLKQTTGLVTLGISFLGIAGEGAYATPNLALTTQPYKNDWGFNQAGMNRQSQPGDNFFEYANGTYLKNLKIPGDMSSYGPFRILYELSQKRQKIILDDVSQTSKNTSDDMKKLGIFYTSYLDQKKIDQQGAQPLSHDLDIIRHVHDPETLAKVFGQSLRSFMFSTFAFGIEQDQRDPTRYMLMLDQGMSIGVSGGLGLPDISYYTDPKLASKKEAYQQYIAHMLSLITWGDEQKTAAQVVKLETMLAGVETPRDQTRDPLKVFNPMPVKKLVSLAPGVDWMHFLQAAGIPQKGLENRIIDVREPKAIAAMANILSKTDPSVLQAWLAFHLTDNAAPYLSHDFSDAFFDFNGRVLTGLSEQPARWKRAISTTNTAMGWALGREYVHRYFPETAKERITSLVQELKVAFHERLNHNIWMDTATREKALVKLDHFAIQVGYPKKWRHYSSLDIRQGDVYGNAERGQAFNWEYQLSHLDRPVDRDDWDMTPQTVNAYNDPTMNEIVFPAAILQPPFFDPKGDMAVNYGAIGGVIGHEMSHGFDDQGRHYDEHGRLYDWWTPRSSEAFDKLAKRLGAQYDAQEVLPGLHVNGAMTMGENIADLGGLNLGLQAYHNTLRGAKSTIVHGFTGEQRVFLGWAQVWREKDRPDALRRQMLSNEHAPAITRVNIPVRNVDAWYDAFGVKLDQKLYLRPDNRVKIW